MAEGKAQMSPTDRTRLYEAVRIARSTTATRDQIKDAARVQGELRKKYPDIYGATRREMFNMVEAGNREMNKGGMAKKKYNKGGYATCGASNPATQASTKKLASGGLLKPNNPGLKKLPEPVRNKMGYMYGGGMAKKK